MDSRNVEILIEEKWPELLKEINDPPKKLYIRGELPPTEHKWLSVVGSRKYSPYGKDACEKILEGLRGEDVVIVSGLALGIDSIAHRKALEIGLKTVAVPGSGLSDKVLYPSSHRNLAKKIIEAGGCLLSEFEPEFKATPYSFPQRNRIMAGLSEATLVIEAGEKSGTLITARLAADYNRDVLAVPGSIFSENSSGTNMLIKLGAYVIRSSDDLRESLGLEKKPSEDKFTDCSEEEKAIVELLGTPLPKDELIRQSKLSISEAQILLSTMEIKGMIKESYGEIRLNIS
jgi:DNA processing protein